MNVNRYLRQTSLKEFGDEAQQKLSSAKVLVVGAGGLGIPVLQYLTSMGVGTIGIVENDIIDITNLQRQVIYSENHLGQPKIYSVINTLKDLNSEVALLPFKTFLTNENALKIISGFDLVIDCSDNFPTRYLINDACVILNKPFVYGALHGFEGQLSVFNFKDGPTYRCLFPEMPGTDEIPDCNENGVLGVIPGIIGTLQALEVVKVLTGIGEIVSGKLLLYDGLRQEFTNMHFKTNEKNKSISKLQDDYGVNDCVSENSIDKSEFLRVLDSRETITIIDVRTEQEFENGHLPNSKNQPLHTIEESVNDSTLYKIKPIYLICQSGVRSRKAQKILQFKYTDIEFINIEGGYNAIGEKFLTAKQR